jgi:hypothetical protein
MFRKSDEGTFRVLKFCFLLSALKAMAAEAVREMHKTALNRSATQTQVSKSL